VRFGPAGGIVLPGGKWIEIIYGRSINAAASCGAPASGLVVFMWGKMMASMPFKVAT
jgi:hypothetical protein